jgi:Zn-finger protein
LKSYTTSAITDPYLQWTKSRPSAKCGWCPCKVQTREHLFKYCPCWKPQQKILWAEVRKETGRGRSCFKIRDLFADERCTRSILDFLRATEVGRRTGPKQGREEETDKWERGRNDEGAGSDREEDED